MERMLCTATVSGTFGLSGEVKIRPNNEDFAYLAKIKTAVLRFSDGTERPATVESYRKVGGLPLMKFVGYDNPEDAKVLSGCRLFVDRNDASPLHKGQHYVADLLGCRIHHKGETLGEVVGSRDGAQAVLLEVRLADGRTAMVPYLDVFIGTVDEDSRSIELKAPWLLS